MASAPHREPRQAGLAVRQLASLGHCTPDTEYELVTGGFDQVLAFLGIVLP